MKNIFIFSGTKNLYETVIKSELEDLKKNYNVFVFREYQNVPKNIRGVVYVNIFKQRQKKLYVLNKIQNAFYTKNQLLKAFIKNNPTHIILHSDWVLREWQAIYFAKTIYSATIIKRTPTSLFNPQSDYLWLRKRSSWLRRTLSRFFNQVILSFFTTGKLHRTNIRWFPTRTHFYKKSKNNFDLSFCYCDKTRQALKKTFESSKVLKWPQSEKYNEKKTNNNFLVICSSEQEHVAAAANTSLNTAKKITNLLILNVIKKILSLNRRCFVKFKNRSDLASFKNQNKKDLKKIKEKIQFINPNENIYKIIFKFGNIVAFVTGVLWKMSLLNTKKRLISYQLYPSPFFSSFKNYPNITFIPFKKAITKKYLEKPLRKTKFQRSQNLKTLAESIV